MRVLKPLLLMCFCGAADAAVFEVTTSADAGAGSFRQAIIDANAAGAGAHTIRFQFATTTTPVTPLPVLQAANLHIDGNGNTPRIRGTSQGSASLLVAGAGVSTLRITDLHLREATSMAGGGCLTGTGVPTTAQLTVEDSIFVSCVADESARNGGGIRWEAVDGSLVVRDSIFSSNEASSASFETAGGAIFTTAAPTLERNQFIQNLTRGSSGLGGAVRIDASPGQNVLIRNNVFRSNRHIGAGGGSDTSGGLGGAIWMDCRDCFAIVENNYFSQNAANIGGAVAMRGYGSPGSTVVMANNTFHRNEADGINARGGGAWLYLLSLAMVHNTFEGSSSGGEGAHLWVEGNSGIAVEFMNNNLLGPVSADSIAEGCSLSFGLQVNQPRGNLFSDSSCLPLQAGSTTRSPGGFDIDAPANEVGVVQVPVLRYGPGSPVVDGGDPSACSLRDARGQLRPLDGDDDGFAVCDVGAFEHPGLQLFGDGFEDAAAVTAEWLL